MRTGRLDAEFEDFVRARTPALLRTAWLLSGDHQHAEDLLQQALWKVSRRWSRARDAPEAYTRRTLVNLATDAHRRRGARLREAPLTEQHTGPAVAADDGGLVERDSVVRALRQLPAQQRAVLVLRFYEDLSVEQTAHALDCSTGTVKSHTSRAVQRMRALLEDQEKQSC